MEHCCDLIVRITCYFFLMFLLTVADGVDNTVGDASELLEAVHVVEVGGGRVAGDDLELRSVHPLTDPCPTHSFQTSPLGHTACSSASRTAFCNILHHAPVHIWR